jgi:phytoene dehydrogenase-like protein
MTSAADVVVVGAGHNGLIAATYLARGGASVLVLEARDDVGGCAATVDAIGARINICNCDHMLLHTTPIVEELDLVRHGLRYEPLDPSLTGLGWDDSSTPWIVHTDAARTLEGLAASHPDEVDGYRRYLAAALPVAELVAELAGAPPSPAAVLRRLAARRAEGARTLLAWSRRPVERVLRGFFRDPTILGTAFTVGPAVWGSAPSTPRTGLGALPLAMRHRFGVARPQGGSGALPAALRRALEEAGGRVRLGAPVERLLVDGGRVRGVVLRDGEVVDARVVVATGDPRAVLVDWMQQPPAGAERLVRRWRGRARLDGYESKVDAVIDAVPRLRAADRLAAVHAGVDPWRGTIVVTPDLAEAEAAHAAAQRGEVAPRPICLVNVPSVPDPTLRVTSGVATAGGDAAREHHVFSLEVLYTPYAVRGGWDGSAEPRRWLERVAGLVEPGFLESIVRSRTMTPPCYEEQFGMPRGHAPSFSGGPLAALAGRDRELTRYETPVQGLYLSGAGTYPGAGIWGASGRNAAAVVARRL